MVQNYGKVVWLHSSARSDTVAHQFNLLGWFPYQWTRRPAKEWICGFFLAPMVACALQRQLWSGLFQKLFQKCERAKV